MLLLLLLLLQEKKKGKVKKDNENCQLTLYIQIHDKRNPIRLPTPSDNTALHYEARIISVHNDNKRHDHIKCLYRHPHKNHENKIMQKNCCCLTTHHGWCFRSFSSGQEYDQCQGQCNAEVEKNLSGRLISKNSAIW